MRDLSDPCFHGCCASPFLCLTESDTQSSKSPGIVAACRADFAVATACTLSPNTQFTNHESLPSLHESFGNFTKAYPQYIQTDQADQIRAKDYYHLSVSKHVCLDYVGHGLFSYSQMQGDCPATSIASSSSSPSPSLKPSFFDISYKSVSLDSQLQHGVPESELEYKIKRRIMAYMNISEDDYSMVFTANQSSAFKILADSYPFQSNPKLLTVYDYENEAAGMMIDSSTKRGAKAISAEFSWPKLRIQSEKLKKRVMSKSKKRKRGLFVFPLQSRMTGARYSYLWMSLAQQNGWHVLLDACALGAKDMDTLGLSLFKPDFLICSFFKVFGENPSGLGCLFVKKSSASVLIKSYIASSGGIVGLIPALTSSEFLTETVNSDTEAKQKSNFGLINERNDASDSFSGPIFTQEKNYDIPESLKTEDISQENKAASHSEIEELENPFELENAKITKSITKKTLGPECEGLERADMLGLILISTRARCQINWLVHALMSLQHPHSGDGLPAVRIYGPKIKFDRGPAVAFNVFDWKGDKIDPVLVQKLADRNNISLSYGFLHHISLLDNYDEKERGVDTKITEAEGTISSKKMDKFQARTSVVTAALGFLTNFEDIYRLWVFVSRFLDADFLEKERWRYKALNQKTIEI